MEDTQMKPCSKCGVNPRREGHSWCRSCIAENTRQWAEKHPGCYDRYNARRTDAQKDLHAKLCREWDEGHPGANHARVAVHRAIRVGKLIPEPCEVCGEARAEAHHPDYSKPLAVRWLCRRCHKRLHSGLISLPLKPAEQAAG